MARPQVLSKPLAGAAGVLAALSLYAWRVETRWLRVTRLTLPVPDLPPAFDGYRIAHLSDLHLGVPVTQRFLPAVVARANREQADLIAITGDFGTGQRDGLAAGEPVLARLDAPDGVWAVLGNHDYYVGPDAVEALLGRAGIRLLRNAHGMIRRGGARLVIAGIDDAIYGFPDLGATLAGVPEGQPVILLAHEPDYARFAAADTRVVLQLSGHTHGGQIRLPGRGPLMLPQLGHMFPAGAFLVERLALYVTSGTGTGRFAMRFNCRPEIAVITLVRGELPRHSTNGARPVWRIRPPVTPRR